MDECGVDRSVIFSPSSGLSSPKDFIDANSSIRDAVAMHPDRLVGFCMVNPMHGNGALDEIKRARHDLDLIGIKLHPPLHGHYFVDSPIVYPLAELAVELDMPIIFHSDWNNLACSPYQICGLARRYPEAKLIMGHMGVDPWMTGQLVELVADVPNVYLETSGTADSPKAVVTLPVARIGVERLLFGSDAPGGDPRLAIMKVRLAGLSPQDEAAVLGLNAARLLRLTLGAT
jgi:predicted TIM-barrel fold metal-dependent hydrolase